MEHIFSGLTPQRYVWVSPTGSDGNSGSESTPLRTIAEALERAEPGTAIMVKAGTYNENVNIQTSGTPSAPIWLISADGNGAAKIVPANTGKDTIKMNGQENLVIQGFDVTEPDEGHYGIKVSMNTWSDLVRNVVVIDNYVHGEGEDGIKVSQGDNIYILDNVVDGATDQGIDLVAVNNSVVAGNEVRNIDGSAGIQVKGGSTNVLVKDNVIRHVEGDGLRIGGGTGESSMRAGFQPYEARNVRVEGNVIHDVDDRGVWFMGAWDSQLVGNWVYDVGSSDVVELLASPVHDTPFVTRNITITGNSFDRTGWLEVEAGQGIGLNESGNLTSGTRPPGNGGGSGTPDPGETIVATITATDGGEAASARSAAFTVRLSALSNTPVTVNYATRDGTAESGADYVAIPSGSITIPAGAISATIVVTMLDDATVEANETMDVTLLGAAGAAVGAQSVAVGRIVDDDTASVRIEGGPPVEEAAEEAVFTVRLSAPSSVDTVVSYRTENGSALSGRDYVAAGNGQVVVPAGALTASIAVAVSDDSNHEANETFSVILTRVSGNGGVILAPQANATATIVDDDSSTGPSPIPGGGGVTVTVADVAVVEQDDGLSHAILVVALSGPATSDIVVRYHTRDGTGLAGVDYAEIANGVVTIAAGQSRAEIPISVLGDAEQEGDETFAIDLTLSSGGAATAGTSESAVLTITDDDVATAARTPSATLAGGEQADSLIGPVGHDRLDGRGGDDSVFGWDGHDTLIGAAGNDRLFGDLPGAGDDVIFGDGGDDTGLGGDGHDTLNGGDGNDFLFGENGHDAVRGNAGRDVLLGGGDADWLMGGVDDDILLGDDGSDTLDGGAGNDRLHVDGLDVFAAGGAGGFDVVVPVGNLVRSISLADPVNQNLNDNGPLLTGFEAIDASLAGIAMSMTGAVLSGGIGTVLIGSWFDDTIAGATAADVILGNPGADRIFGGGGNDTIIADAGNDFIHGGNGADLFFFPGGDLSGNVAIDDFAIGQDQLMLSASFGLTPEEAVAAAQEVSGGVRLPLGAGMSVTLVGVAIDALTESAIAIL